MRTAYFCGFGGVYLPPAPDTQPLDTPWKGHGTTDTLPSKKNMVPEIP